METIKERFFVQDRTGRQFALVLIQEHIDTSNYLEPDATVPGMRRIETAGGEPVTMIDDNTFVIVNEGVRVTRVKQLRN
ncbi:MAG: hypothetical protein ACKVP5_10035 [Aestuariivirga sp.]